MADEKTGLILVAVVAIVAILGMVMLFGGSNVNLSGHTANLQIVCGNLGDQYQRCLVQEPAPNPQACAAIAAAAQRLGC